MGNLVITGGSAITFKALIDNATGTADKYYLRIPVPRGEIRAWQKKSAPAVDGQKRKDAGFRSRHHGPFRVLIVSSNETALKTDVEAIKTALEGKACTIAYPDGLSATDCFLVEGYPDPAGNREYDPASTFWYVELNLMFEEN